MDEESWGIEAKKLRNLFKVTKQAEEYLLCVGLQNDSQLPKSNHLTIKLDCSMWSPNIGTL